MFMTHVEVYLDWAVYRDPLQHGDVVGGCEGVAEHVNILLDLSQDAVASVAVGLSVCHITFVLWVIAIN